MTTTTKHTQQHAQAGFTLVELSIVLVIIGLIIGGVLVGQDLIKAAEIRSQVAQIQEYNSAVNAFRDRYQVIPGDVGAVKATQFGFNDAANRVPGTNNCDQDGLIECNAAGCADIRAFGGETAVFWTDLYDTLLIAAELDTATSAVDGGAGANIVPGDLTNDLNDFLPGAKLGRGNYIMAFSASGRNFFQLGGVTSIANGTGAYALANNLTPVEAFNIDAKMDDEMPLTGTVRAVIDVTSLNENVATFDPNSGASVPQAAAVGVCVENANNTYNAVNEDSRLVPSCQQRFQLN